MFYGCENEIKSFQFMLSQLVLNGNDNFLNINELSTMAKYYNCDNQIGSPVTMLANLVVLDSNGDPVLNVIENNTTEKFFSCDNPMPSTIESVIATVTYEDGNGNPYIKTNCGTISANPIPVFTAFEIQGQNNEIEVGQPLTAGSKTFTWTVTNPTSINTNSIRIINVNTSTTLAQNLPNTGSALITLPEITNNVEATQVFRIELTDTNNIVRSRTYTITWVLELLSTTYIDAVIASTGTLTVPKQNKIITLLGGLNQNLLNKLKALYLLEGGINASIIINALKPNNNLGSFTANVVGSPVIDANGGFTASSTSYLKSGFHPDGGGLTFLTGATFGFSAPEGLQSNEYTIGLYPKFWFGNVLDGATLKGYVSLGGSIIEIPSRITSGIYIFTREPNSNIVKAYHNGSQYFSITTDTFLGSYSPTIQTSFPTIGGMVELAPGEVNYPSTSKIKNAFYGKGLLASEVTELTNLIETYNA